MWIAQQQTGIWLSYSKGAQLWKQLGRKEAWDGFGGTPEYCSEEQEIQLRMLSGCYRYCRENWSLSVSTETTNNERKNIKWSDRLVWHPPSRAQHGNTFLSSGPSLSPWIHWSLSQLADLAVSQLAAFLVSVIRWAFIIILVFCSVLIWELQCKANSSIPINELRILTELKTQVFFIPQDV